MTMALQDAWIVGRNVRFDVGFVTMEIASAGHELQSFSCLDTYLLASAMWELPN